MREIDIRIKHSSEIEVGVIDAQSVKGVTITPEFRGKRKAGRDPRS